MTLCEVFLSQQFQGQRMKGLIMETQCSMSAVKNYYRKMIHVKVPEAQNGEAEDIDSLGSNFANLFPSLEKEEKKGKT